ncbi:hypothetical protein NW754_009995 [Fusarium falciforme]|nr:hypothetical protein NW754_009995 [Fusarium falciforme]KAJ4190590.1 hypothetical protein NW767_011210 [Fusarium falciforme]KAJ4257192.1 hypothetical protein NW757_003814 [Fusarium falciforme]
MDGTAEQISSLMVHDDPTFFHLPFSGIITLAIQTRRSTHYGTGRSASAFATTHTNKQLNLSVCTIPIGFDFCSAWFMISTDDEGKAGLEDAKEKVFFGHRLR